MTNDADGERRVNWARTVADVAVIKEIQVQQTATLAKLDGKLDLLWDEFQRNKGALANEHNASLRWRWLLGLAVSLFGSVLAYRVFTHP